MTRTRPLFEPLRPSAPRRFLGWVQASHPFPLFMVVSLTALVAVASADGGFKSQRFVLMLGAMFFSQLAIGWTNDYVDRQSDAMYQPAKPVPSGAVNAESMPTAIVVAIFASFMLGTMLGSVPLALLATGTVAGLAYDLALKDTRFSPIAFLVAFSVLPFFVWSSLGVFRSPLAVVFLVGAPLAFAAHVANVLPDLEGDAAAGRFNLGVILGRERSLQAVADSMVAAPLLVLITLPFLDYSLGSLALTLFVFGALAAAAAYVYAKPGRNALVWGFRFTALASVLFAAGWLLSV